MIADDALKLDYESTLRFIDKCDDHMFRVKNWTLISASAVIAYSISSGTPSVVLANLLLVPAFLYLEIVYKSFQDSAIDHVGLLEKLIGDSALSDDANGSLSDYEFGFGRVLEYPSIVRCVTVIRNRQRWHILGFYGLVALFSLGAFAYGSLVV